MKRINKKKFPIYLIIVLIFTILLIIGIFRSNLFDKKDNHSASVYVALISYDSADTQDIKDIRSNVKQAAKENKKNFKEFSTTKYNNSYEKAIEAAVDAGAKLIVLPDSSFATTTYKLQNTFDKVDFILIGGAPHNKNNSDDTTLGNVYPLNYDSTQAGFLAGYCAAKDSYKNLGFIGTKDDYDSTHYCYGYLQGADYAASESSSNKINASVVFSDSNSRGEDITNLKSCDLIAIGTTNQDIKKCYQEIAESTKVTVCSSASSVCSDFSDANLLSHTVNDYTTPVYDYICEYFNGNSIPGETTNLTVENDCVDISIDSKDSTVTDSDIAHIKNLLNDGTIQVISDTSIPITELGLKNVNISEY
ncbi:MAG: BMP family ABC transporter substrate-binding protein [Lachnospiraceae bacterium]|nr:BMP family ABC transporter substrate-binding protein [Lachnospiraceae bacterium]